MSSLSRDWVWMAVPKEREVGKEVLPTPLHPASIWPRRRFHFAILSTFSMQWRFSFEPLQFACINQLCLQMPPCVSAVCHWVHKGEEREQGGRGISSSSILSLTSTPFRQHVRIYFFHLPAMNTRLIRLLCAPLSFPFSAMIERELSFTI